MSYELGALIEPLSVGVHAARRANIDLGMRWGFDDHLFFDHLNFFNLF